jgi:hypothetical protein
MRLREFASAQQQLALWKVISDTVWSTLQQQAAEQQRVDAAKAAAKSRSPRRKRRSGRAPSPKFTAVPSAPPAKQAAKQSTPQSSKVTMQQNQKGVGTAVSFSTPSTGVVQQSPAPGTSNTLSVSPNLPTVPPIAAQSGKKPAKRTR